MLPTHTSTHVKHFAAAGLVLFCLTIFALPCNGQHNNNDGQSGSLYTIRKNALEGVSAESRSSTQPTWGMGGTDTRKDDGSSIPGRVRGSDLKAAMYSVAPPIPANFIDFGVPAKRQEGQMKARSIPTTGEPLTDAAQMAIDQVVNAGMLSDMTDPERMVPMAQAAGQAQALGLGNAAGDVARNQAASAIDYSASYLHNFTVEQNNKWNKLRDGIFVPIGLLLLLPGAVLSQVKATVAAGSPGLGESVSPFDGLQRAIVAIFLIPATYLVINYGIDLSNSITYTIGSEYRRIMGSDMYKDALCAQIRAFPVRQPSENRNAVDMPTAQMKPLLGGQSAFAKFEGKMLENKIEDPCSGVYQSPGDRPDEALSSGVAATRLMMNGSNAGLTAAWNVLSAFQMAYLYYLWFVGPVVAGLWVWPMKQLRDALPNWIEGVITLCFWSLFWNTTILLMASFRGVDETGTVIMSALNFLATASVKYAFDFAGLVKAAGQEAAGMAMGNAEKAAQSGGAGGGGAGASSGAGASGGTTSSAPSGRAATPQIPPAVPAAVSQSDMGPDRGDLFGRVANNSPMGGLSDYAGRSEGDNFGDHRADSRRVPEFLNRLALSTSRYALEDGDRSGLPPLSSTTADGQDADQLPKQDSFVDRPPPPPLFKTTVKGQYLAVNPPLFSSEPYWHDSNA